MEGRERTKSRRGGIGWLVAFLIINPITVFTVPIVLSRTRESLPDVVASVIPVDFALFVFGLIYLFPGIPLTQLCSHQYWGRSRYGGVRGRRQSRNKRREPSSSRDG